MQSSVRSRLEMAAVWERTRGGGWPRALLASALVLVAGLGLVVLVVWALGLLAQSGPVARVDRPLYHWFVSHRAGWATTLMNRCTGTGSYTATVTVSVIAGVGLALWRRQPLPLLLLATVPVEKYLQQWTAALVQAPKPPAALSIGPVGAFPSGGSARVVLVGGMVAWMLARYWSGGRLPAVAWTVVVLAAFAEGWSRLYLGRHWVADVLGGWLFGAALLAVLLAAATMLPLADARPRSRRRAAGAEGRSASSREAAGPDRAGARERR